MIWRYTVEIDEETGKSPMVAVVGNLVTIAYPPESQPKIHATFGPQSVDDTGFMGMGDPGDES